MDIQSTKPPPTSSAYPWWVMLKNYGKREDESSCFNADAKTLACARTSTGLLIRVGFSVPPPPAVSGLFFHILDVKNVHGEVLAAHGDSVLIVIRFGNMRLYADTINYFVYNDGAAAAELPRPPSLSLLTPCYLTEEEKERHCLRAEGAMQRWLDTEATGLLQRGEDDDLVVAELKIVAGRQDEHPAPELLLLRSGEWSIRRPLVSNEEDEGGMSLPSSWRTDKVFPLNDQLLCWVDMINGVAFCHVSEEYPRLRYVELPINSYFGRQSFRNVCATAGGGALKFVNIFRRCCCGGAGGTYCKQSNHAYTIHTWMLKTDDMTWVMDSIVDATEIWALDAYKGLPRVRPEYPIVSMDDPHAICFVVNDQEENVRIILLDIRSKTLQSVYQNPERHWHHHQNILIPSRVSDYLNSYQSSSDGDTSIQPQPLVSVDKLEINDVKNSMQSSSESSAKPMQLSDILVVLEEIPDLARDDMLKAYSILCNGNGRRLKNLLGLPMHLRKDWLLMEINASEACFFCSTCAADMQHA